MSILQPGDWVTVDHQGVHYAVVLYVFAESGHSVVIYATSSRRPQFQPLEVYPQDADGRRLQLTVPTYFYPGNCIPIRNAKISSRNKRCPAELFLRLRELCTPQLARLVEMGAEEMQALAERIVHRTILANGK